MVSEVPAGLGALKAAYDLAKGAVGLNTASEINAAVINIQTKLLDAQSDYSALMRKNGELEKEIMSLKSWEAEKERYSLQELPPGIFMFALKEDMRGSEPAHNLCANCYYHGVKSILHVTNSSGGIKHWKCYCCGFEADTGERPPLPRSNSGGGWMAQ
ncbi:hypothetical protein [Brucella pituitosa]|uniref:hypothetical protein n=1 Tax=Brucella pituitosa TaxID=571256 RepID=UPI0009A14E05|nr:hypothetical protein [Brucella pituitosa]